MTTSPKLLRARKPPKRQLPSQVQQQIKNRGSEQIETSDFMTTQVKLEFNITNHTAKLNPHPKHLELLKLIKTIDPSAISVSVFDDTEWDNLLEFPINDTYKKHFNVTISNPPQHGTRKMISHFTPHTKKRVNDIKFTDTVLIQFLQTNDIYLVVDRFKMQRIASIGYLTMIHPKLTWDWLPKPSSQQ
eukprot:scaffold93527_cov56-Attheya_sp.AAC.2